MGLCSAACQGPPPVGNGPEEKQHLIPAKVSSVLLMLVRDWHNPEARGALAAGRQALAFAFTPLSTHQLGWGEEETALGWWGDISMIQMIQGWAPWGRGRRSSKSSQEEALVGGREGEECNRL